MDSVATGLGGGVPAGVGAAAFRMFGTVKAWPRQATKGLLRVHSTRSCPAGLPVGAVVVAVAEAGYAQLGGSPSRLELLLGVPRFCGCAVRAGSVGGFWWLRCRGVPN